MNEQTLKTPTNQAELDQVLNRQEAIKAEIKLLSAEIIRLEKAAVPMHKKRRNLQNEFRLLDVQRFNIDGSQVKFIKPRKTRKKVTVSPSRLELSRAIKDAFGHMTKTERSEILAMI